MYKLNFTAILLLIVAYSSYAQKSFVENGKLNGVMPLDDAGNVAYVVVEQADGVKKDELYKRARGWFSKNYNSPKDVLQLTDPQTGEVSGRGVFDFTSKIARVKVGGELDHTIQVELKDGRYRITLSKVILNHEPIERYKMPLIGTTKNNYTQLYTTLDQQLRTLIASLQKALATSNDF